MSANLENSAVAIGPLWKRSVFIPIPKNGNAKECSSYHIIVLISHASKVMLKILQAMSQQYANQELSRFQARFRKGRGTRDQIANICWIIEKAREFQKTSTSALLRDYAKAFDCVEHNKLWKILKEMGIRPPYLSPDKPVCRSGSNSWKWTWNSRLVPNRKRSTSRLYIVTLLI